MGKHDFIRIAFPAEQGDVLDVDVRRREDVQADAVKRNVDAFGEDSLVVGDVPRIGDVADHNFFRIGAFRDQELRLFHTARRAFRVGDDRHAGGFLRGGRRLENGRFIRRDGPAAAGAALEKYSLNNCNRRQLIFLSGGFAAVGLSQFIKQIACGAKFLYG